MKRGFELPPTCESITNTELNKWLSHFVVEARNKQGNRYPGGTLYSLCSGIQRYVREKRTAASVTDPVDIYKDPGFMFFRSSFDSILKELHVSGVGNRKRQAEVISYDVEDRLWADGHLGDNKPQQLLDTLVYCLGLNLALRSGKEHRDLRPDMFQVFESIETGPYLLYTESGSKNHLGGLRDRKRENKSVKIFANQDNLDRCVMRLYTKYRSLRPMNAPADIFYLKPLINPSPECWFSSKPVGHNLLTKTVKRLW